MTAVASLRSLLPRLRRAVDTRKALIGPGMSTSAMVALYPSPAVAEALALPGGTEPDDLHITLAYLGADAVIRLDRDAVEAAVSTLATALSPLTGVVSGIGRFTPEVPPGTGEEDWPLVALIDIPALPEFRQRLVATLEAAGAPVARNHGFCPHMTLAMVGPEDEYAAIQVLSAGVDPVPLSFGEIVVAWGDDRRAFPLAGSAAKSLLGERTADETRTLLQRAVVDRVGASTTRWVYVRDFTASALVYAVEDQGDNPRYWMARYTIGDDETVELGEPTEVEPETGYQPKVMKAKAGPVVKTDEPKRYTFAPLYPASPEKPTLADLDAHGDFATADDIQKAVWDYVRKGDLRLREQHDPSVVVGEVVEIVTWPWPVTVPVTTVDGTTVNKTYNAGTAFMGAVWTEEAWPDVLSGKRTGWSLGGRAVRVDVEVEG